MSKKTTATQLNSDWFNSVQAGMVRALEGATKKKKKEPQSVADVAADGFWRAPDWPALSMLEAGARAIEAAGTPFTRLEAAWREMRAVAVAATSPAIPQAVGAANIVAPARPTDTDRLDCLSNMDGFVRGSFQGEPAYRVMTRTTWHPTLRAAIDDVIATPPKLNEE